MVCVFVVAVASATVTLILNEVAAGTGGISVDPVEISVPA